jgi:hypothetical protein
MKKTILAALILLLFNMAGSAQTTPKKAVLPAQVVPPKQA